MNHRMQIINEYKSRNAATAILACLLLGIMQGATSDTLYRKDGEQAQGTLKQMTPEAVIFEGQQGQITLPKSDVLRIQLQRARQFDDIESVDHITDSDLKACVERQPSEKDYPADGSVALLERSTYDLTTTGVVKETHRSIVKVLQQRGEDVGSHNVWYFEDTETPEVDFALTVTPDGRVLHLSDAALKIESIYAQLPDYRRLTRCRFACKEPRPGSILDVQYTVTRKRESLLEPFYTEEAFRDSAPILKKEVIVLCPSDNIPNWELNSHATKNDLVKAEVQTQGSCTRISWTLTAPQSGIIEEPMMPPNEYFVPRLVIAAKADWKDIASAYAKALDTLSPLSEPLRTKAVELAGKGGAAAIYDFVVRSLRTIPVPQLHFRSVPHTADQTAARGMANELDKDFLYYQMLRAAGIECSFALVRDRLRGPISERAPSLRAFNRSAVYLTKERRFSNAASDLLMFGDLDGSLQDSPALLVASDADSLKNTQQARLDEECSSTSFDSSLDADGNLTISLTYSGRGNSAAWMRNFKDMNAQELQNYLQQVAGALHPAARLDRFETTALDDLTVEPSITLHCTIQGFATKAGDLMLFNIPAMNHDAGDVGRPSREQDLFWGNIERQTLEGSVRLPEGYRAYSVPRKAHQRSGVVSYRAAVKVNGANLHIRDAFDLKVPYATKDAYPEYKQCKETGADFARQRVILTR